MITKLPQWTTALTDTNIAGEDQLGIQSVPVALQDELLPGIITVTDHARYYSFYCWVLYRYRKEHNSNPTLDGFRDKNYRYFKRRELAFLLGCYKHHNIHDRWLSGIVGAGINYSTAKRIWKQGGKISLDPQPDYFQNLLGGFGQYYRSVMQEMGLIKAVERSDEVYKLTERGGALAKAFEEAIQHTSYFKQITEDPDLTYLDEAVIVEYGEAACLCSEGLAKAPRERDLLREAFFRFVRVPIDYNPASKRFPHVQRRLSLGLLLDLVDQAGGAHFSDSLRPVLYLGQYLGGKYYTPQHPVLEEWYKKWRMVLIRMYYNGALQALWAVFLNDCLHSINRSTGISLQEFIDWGVARLPESLSEKSVDNFLSELCGQVNLPQEWSSSAFEFEKACPLHDNGDEQIGLYDETILYWLLVRNKRDTKNTLYFALRILLQIFLRFYPLYSQQNPSNLTWLHMANKNPDRLPVNRFFDEMLNNLTNPSHPYSIHQFLTQLYRDYIFSQHEYIALMKLRNQNYDTFKFYFQEGRFYLPDSAIGYTEPVGYPGLRLFNALMMLTDLGLVEQKSDRSYILTSDGQTYLQRVIEIDYVD